MAKQAVNRALKFRAWNIEKKDWESSFAMSNDGIFMRLGVGQKDEGIVTMQFIGVVDSNKKEIYEGDIVKAEDGIWEVTVRDLENGVVLLNHPKEEGSANHVEGLYHLGETEVIGNIYENPELLNG